MYIGNVEDICMCLHFLNFYINATVNLVVIFNFTDCFILWLVAYFFLSAFSVRQHLDGGISPDS